MHGSRNIPKHEERTFSARELCAFESFCRGAKRLTIPIHRNFTGYFFLSFPFLVLLNLLSGSLAQAVVIEIVIEILKAFGNDPCFIHDMLKH